jgi:hypothetical protein
MAKTKSMKDPSSAAKKHHIQGKQAPMIVDGKKHTERKLPKSQLKGGY